MGINYSIYTYFIANQLDSLEKAKSKYLQKQQKLNELNSKKEAIKNEKNEVEKLKNQTSDFNNKVPSQINTPQLIYDFYTGCKIYDISGESVSFQLLNQEEVPNNQNKVTTGDVNKNTSESFFTLTIELNVIGEKEKIENFIKNLANLTTRQLNVKSIAIATVEENLANQSLIEDLLTKSKLSADIVFCQYIQKNKKYNTKEDYNYEFYDSKKEGFKNISDMFK